MKRTVKIISALLSVIMVLAAYYKYYESVCNLINQGN